MTRAKRIEADAPTMKDAYDLTEEQEAHAARGSRPRL